MDHHEHTHKGLSNTASRSMSHNHIRCHGGWLRQVYGWEEMEDLYDFGTNPALLQCLFYSRITGLLGFRPYDMKVRLPACQHVVVSITIFSKFRKRLVPNRPARMPMLRPAKKQTVVENCQSMNRDVVAATAQQIRSHLCTMFHIGFSAQAVVPLRLLEVSSPTFA